MTEWGVKKVIALDGIRPIRTLAIRDVRQTCSRDYFSRQCRTGTSSRRACTKVPPWTFKMCKTLIGHLHSCHAFIAWLSATDSQCNRAATHCEFETSDWDTSAVCRWLHKTQKLSCYASPSKAGKHATTDRQWKSHRHTCSLKDSKHQILWRAFSTYKRRHTICMLYACQIEDLPAQKLTVVNSL